MLLCDNCDLGLYHLYCERMLRWLSLSLGGGMLSVRLGPWMLFADTEVLFTCRPDAQAIFSAGGCMALPRLPPGAIDCGLCHCRGADCSIS